MGEEEEEEGMNYSWAQREGGRERGREAATRKREGKRRGEYCGANATYTHMAKRKTTIPPFSAAERSC